MFKCQVDNCNRNVEIIAYKLCRMHYKRLWKHGTTDYVGRQIISVEIRFWKRVNKTDGCWVWTGGTTTAGYGKIGLGGRGGEQRDTHRFSWEMHFGEIPDGLCVLHKCDNKPCVRPDHLFLGTHSDNMIDAYDKGIMKKGSARSDAKINENMAKEIRESKENGTTLAAKFGVSDALIYRIRKNKTWKHVE